MPFPSSHSTRLESIVSNESTSSGSTRFGLFFAILLCARFSGFVQHCCHLRLLRRFVDAAVKRIGQVDAVVTHESRYFYYVSWVAFQVKFNVSWCVVCFVCGDENGYSASVI